MLTIKQKRFESMKQVWIRIIDNVYREGEHIVDQRGNNVIKYLNVHTIFDSPYNKHQYIDNPRLEENFFNRLFEVHKQGFDYTYGNRINEGWQIGNVIDKLKENKYTRRAIIDIARPTDVGSELEIPCVTQLHFNYSKGKLHLNCFMRSNDIVGALPSDVYGYYNLLCFVAGELGYNVGSYNHIVTDNHIILDHYEDKLKALRIT